MDQTSSACDTISHSHEKKNEWKGVRQPLKPFLIIPCNTRHGGIGWTEAFLKISATASENVPSGCSKGRFISAGPFWSAPSTKNAKFLHVHVSSYEKRRLMRLRECAGWLEFVRRTSENTFFSSCGSYVSSGALHMRFFATTLKAR